MITPAYGLTATERVLPRLALDWTTGLSQSGIDVVRAGLATFVGSNGFIQSASANTQRLDWSTGTAGLLVEEARTNILVQSSQFNTTWTVSGTAAITVDQIASPDNTVNSDLFRCGATSASEVRQNNLSIAAGSHTFSLFVKKETSNFVVIQVFDVTTSSLQRRWFNISTGTVGSTSSLGANVTLVSSDIKPSANGFYRVSITVSLTSLTTAGRVSVFVSETNGAFDGTALSGIYLYGAQLEAGAFSTSYIPTTTTAVTRNADLASMTGTNFSDWYNASEGSFAARFIFGNDKVGTRVALASDGTSGNYVGVLGSTGGGTGPFFGVATGGVTQTTLPSPGAITENTEYNVCGAYKTDDCVGAKNGEAFAVDITSTIPTVNRLELGASAGTSFLNGHIMQVQYWPMRLTNNEVRAFSK
tara:strand:- start:1687 stop:2937 length:1251 start_codon:yes stop_codon:yes gene_type:complete